MRSKRHDQGTIINYPYRWLHQQESRLDHPKTRPACLLLKIERPSGAALALVAISDFENKAKGACVRVPEAEKARAGLSEFRNAFVHLSEYNIDREKRSVSYDARAEIRGRFSKPCVAMLAKHLAANIRRGNAAKIDRDQG